MSVYCDPALKVFAVSLVVSVTSCILGLYALMTIASVKQALDEIVTEVRDFIESVETDNGQE